MQLFSFTQIFLLFLSFGLSVNSTAQNIPLDEYTTDTILLKDFKVKKIIAYKYHSVTFYVNYYDCAKTFSNLLKVYKDDHQSEEDTSLLTLDSTVKRLLSQVKESHTLTSAENARLLLLDSTVKYLQSEARKSDTVYLSQSKFEQYDLDPLQDFLPDQIEKGTCAIKDEKNKKHFIIIRQKGSWQRGPLSGWGGRRYFLPGHKTWFIQGMDWIS